MSTTSSSSSSSNSITQTEIDNLPPPPISWTYFSSSAFKDRLINKCQNKDYHIRIGRLSGGGWASNFLTGSYYPKTYSPLFLKRYNNINKSTKTKKTCLSKNGYSHVDAFGQVIDYHDEELYKYELQEWLDINKIKYKKSSSYKILAELFMQHW